MLFGSLLLRISLHTFYTFKIDHNTFIAWGNAILRYGPSTFYSSVWSDYLPGYLYVLWIVASVEKFAWLSPELLYKLPAILGDLCTIFIGYKIVLQKHSEKKAIISAGALSVGLAIIANSSMWGQVDIFTVLFPLLSLYFFQKNEYLSALFLSVGFSFKPQAAIAVPVLFYLMLLHKWGIKRMFRYGLISVLVLLLVFMPFYGSGNILAFISERISATLGQYQYGSINAFNFWGLWGFWKPEGNGQILGIITTAVISLLVVLINRKRPGREYLILSLLLFANFMFFTRMHERHLLPAIVPLAIAAIDAPVLWISYVVLSVTYVLNLYYSWFWIEHSFASPYSETLIKLFIATNIFVFLLTFRESLKKKFSTVKTFGKHFFKIKPGSSAIHTRDSLTKKNARVLLYLILSFSLLVRIIGLGNPSTDYFDEIYHAFTARSLAHGEPYVWDWQSASPAGFAYEWTHPPLAKEIMAISIYVFGENSFVWRLPGSLLSVLSIALVYMIAETLFKRRDIALISAALMSLDGLVLTMSRIGTADVYFLFFMLLCFYLFLKDKHFASAAALGLSAASKWSAIWFLPVLVLCLLLLRKKIKLSYMFYFVLPPAIYLLSYLPMFIHGYDFEHFIGMQKQMWWYHSGLKATHPYTSLWWTWPFMIRPVYLYQNYTAETKHIANIYAIGNPLVFWLGIVGVLGTTWEAVKRRSLLLLSLVSSYFVFFAPWALSPRIMFIYHYLPSVPFMAIATGYLLRQHPRFIKPALIVGVVLFIYFYPHWAAVSIPEAWDRTYYWFPSWR